MVSETEEAFVAKLAAVKPFLDERQWRLLLGAEARAIGWGGIALVARLAGASRTTVQTGVNEIRAGLQPDGRVRGPGAGRPTVEDEQPGIEDALVVATRRTVARLLKQADYRLQATFKTKEGAQRPDRDAQFGHINGTAAEFLAAGDPVASITRS